jgi:hypothetical protein
MAKKKSAFKQSKTGYESTIKFTNFDSIVLDQFNSSATIQSLSGDFPIRELTWSVSTKMKAFSKMKELFNAGLVDIYPHDRAIRQVKKPQCSL